MAAKAKKFEVRLRRTCPQYYRVEVRATTRDEARGRAIELAPNLDFHEGTTGEAEYDVDEVNEIESEENRNESPR